MDTVVSKNGEVIRMQGTPSDERNTEYGTMRQTGGVTSLQLGLNGLDDAERVKPQQIRMPSGTYKIGMGAEGGVEHKQVTSMNSADIMPDPNASVLATARDSVVTPDTVVNVPGLGETNAETAFRMGYLRKEGNTYLDLNSSPAPAPAPSPEVKQEDNSNENSKENNDNVQMLEGDIESTIEGYYQTGGETATDKLLNEVIMAGGELSDDSLNHLAPQFGKSSDQLKGELQVIAQGFQKQAEYTVQRIDSEVDPVEVFKYALQTYDREKIQDIQRRHFAGDTSGYKDLVDHYNSNKMSESRFMRLHAKGWKFNKKADGKWYWSHPEHGDIAESETMYSPLLK